MHRPAWHEVSEAVPPKVKMFQLVRGHERFRKLFSSVFSHVTPMAFKPLQHAAFLEKVGKGRARLLSDSIVGQNELDDFLAFGQSIHNCGNSCIAEKLKNSRSGEDTLMAARGFNRMSLDNFERIMPSVSTRAGRRSTKVPELIVPNGQGSQVALLGSELQSERKRTDGTNLVVVQQQRRERLAGLEPLAECSRTVVKNHVG